MKKSLLFVFAFVLLFASVALVQAEDVVTIKIGASPTPHAEILNAAKDVLAEKGIKLDIVEFTDYVIPNTALEDGSLEANYFQHQPYLDDFNKQHKAENPKWVDLVSVAKIHFEPLGIYAGKTKALADIKDGAKIAVPNDTTNEARALLLLEANGLIKVAEGKGLEATKKDIVENPHKIDIVELEAAQVPHALADVDFGVINGNYALSAGLSSKDVLASEAADSEAAQTYANIIVVRDGDQDKPEIKKLVEALQSDSVKKFIQDKYNGVVVPVF